MIAGVALVKDEADIIEDTLLHALEQFDFLLVSDNGSTDGTADLIRGLEDERVELVLDPEVGYYQSRKMTALAHVAETMGAEWVVPFDADEFWVPVEGDTVRAVLREQADDVAAVTATMLNHVCTDQDSQRESPARRMRWRLSEVGAMPKVAVRPSLPVTILQGNHDAGWPSQTAKGLLTIHHYPYRSVEQTIRKARNGAAAYAAAPDLPDHYGDHWRKYGQMSDEKLQAVFREWWYFVAPDHDRRLVYDPLEEALHGAGAASR